MGGLGAREGPPVCYTWRTVALGDSAVFAAVSSGRAVPWVVILVLCLLKPNRRWSAWLVWLPLLAVAGLAWLLEAGESLVDSSTLETVRLLALALGFGWAAVLLLAPWAPWPPKLGRWGSLLLVLGVFALPGLAFGHDWGQGMIDEIMSLVCAVVLQFVVFALATALSLAGRTVCRRFNIPKLVGWLFLWLLVVWAALAVPGVALTALSDSEVTVAVLVLVVCCCLGSFVVSLLFLGLGTVSSILRERIQRVVLPLESSTATRSATSPSA